MKYVQSFFSASIVLAVLCVALPVSAATYTVTTTADELDSTTDCTDNPSDCSLREAISQANADEDADTIVLSDGTYTIALSGTGENDNATGDLDLTLGDITITGESEAGTIIDGGSLDGVFHIQSTAGAVSFSDLTIQNGITSNGGGVNISGSSARSFENVTLTGNEATNQGGGMYINSSATITFTNLNFTSNTSSSLGGAILFTGSSMETTCDTCNFSENTSSSNGGAVHVYSGTHAFENATLTDNSGNSGGALSIYNGEVSFNESTFSDNQAAGKGGAVSISKIDDLYFRNTVFTGNNADQHGGALNLSSTSTSNTSTTYLENVIIEGNTTNGKGGAIHAEKNNLYIHSSTIVNNTADIDDGVAGNGGGLYVHDNQVAVEFYNSIISNNVIGPDETPENCSTETDDFITTGGYNIDSGDTCNFDSASTDLTDTDPLLDTDGLQDNGGAVETIALQSSSPAIDFVPAASCVDYASEALSRDIRGMQRPENTDCDAGAYEADQTAPTVSFATTTLECSEDTWSNSSVTASDNFDSSVSVNLTGTVSDDVVGTYTLSYSSTDTEGNEASGDQDITVEDTTDPTVTVTGESSVTITEGDSYADAGATATDTCDSSVAVTSSGSVDSDTPGTYTITYTATDDSNNTDTATRTVTVEEAAEEEPEGGDSEESDGPVNDVDSGEGDGSNDTEETLGAVVDLTRTTDSTVTVEYEEGETKTFQLFNSSAKAKVQLHTNGAILIAINKTYMRTFDAFTGEQIDQVKLFKNKQYKTKFKRFNVYKKVPGKNNVIVLAQTKKKHKKQFKLRSFVVKNGGAITKRPYRKITLNKNTKFSKLAISKNKKSGKKARIRVERKGKVLKNYKYRVTKKKGILKKVD